jgi:hypothetical protein
VLRSPAVLLMLGAVAVLGCDPVDLEADCPPQTDYQARLLIDQVLVQSVGADPSVLGGAVTDGLYDLVEWYKESRGQPPEPDMALTLRISGAATRWVALEETLGASQQRVAERSSGAMVLGNTTLQLQQSCPRQATRTFAYISEPNRFVLLTSDEAWQFWRR